MKSLAGIRQRCQNANDPLFYDRMYVLQVATAGYLEWIDSGIGGLCRNYGRSRQGLGKADIPDYPMIDPGEQLRGVANHMLVNARISVASVVLTLPEIHLKIDDLTEREIGEKWFEDSWINGEWSKEVEMAGMDVESTAIGWMVCGASDDPASDQQTMWIHVDPLDMLFDRGYKSPGRWRFFCYRERVPLDDAVERFGHIFNQDFAARGGAERQKLQDEHGILDDVTPSLTDHELTAVEVYDKIKDLCVQRIDPLNRGWMNVATGVGDLAGDSNINDYVLHVWHYWDRDHHGLFLNSIDGAKSIPLSFRNMAGPDSGWNYQVATEAGPNPYGILPGAWWIGNWAAGMLRPTPKAETVKPLSDMIRYIEALMVKALKQSLPMIVINSGGLGTQEVEFRRQWNKAIESDKPMEFLEMTYGTQLKDVIQRLDVGGFPAEWLELRQSLKAELDAATGVSAPYRGQSFAGGEKTRKEASDLSNASSTQQRDMRNKYASFLEMMVRVSRIVGSVVDNKPRLLMLDDGPVQINGKGFPIAQFLSKPAHVFVDPNDAVFRPKEEIQAEALAEWKEHQVMIQLGQISPRRACENFLAKFGGRKAMKLLFNDKELQQNQQAKSEQAQKAAIDNAISGIKIELAELPDMVKQAIFESMGLLPKGTPVDWGPNTTEKFDATVELGQHAASIEHEQRMSSMDRIQAATEQGREHRHQLQKQKEAPKPAVTAGKPKAKTAAKK